MHLLTAFLLCITSISSSETQTCPASTIAALSVKGALVKAIQCAYSARTGSYTNQADIDVVIVNCLNQIMYLDSTSAPVLGTQCRVCYQGLIMDIIKLSVGRMVSGSFVATVSTFNSDCGITTTLAGQERCMKNVDIRSPMVTFAKCSGYSVIFPASGDLKTRRQFNRVDIFGNMLRLALGTGVVLSGILSQVVSSVNSPPTPSGNLHMQLCYLTFVEDLKEAKILMSDSAIVDCSSSYATNVCLSNGNVVGAMTRFSKCTNFMIDQWYNACDSHSLEKIYGNFDAIKALIPVIVSGYSSSQVNFASLIAPVVYQISQFGASDCAECFSELAWDIRANILNRRAALADETFASFLNYCRDPHGSNCALMIGSQALINFKQCSGFALDLQSLPTSSPTAIPTPGGSTTAPTTTPTRASNNTNVTSKSRLIKDYLASLFSILVVTALL